MTARRRISGTERLEIFIREGGICHICGGKINGKPWDISHEIPLEMGGEDYGNNLRIAHRACHQTHTAEHDIPAIRKAQRIERKHAGIRKQRTITTWRRFSGEIVRAPRSR